MFPWGLFKTTTPPRRLSSRILSEHPEDFACPIYQPLDAETNERLSLQNLPRVTSFTIINNRVHKKSVKANLSLLDPDVHMGRQVSSHADEQDIQLIVQHIKRIVDSFALDYPRYVQYINACMASEEEFSGNFDQIRNGTNCFLLNTPSHHAQFHIETEDLLLPQMPRTVRDRLQRHFDNVRSGLKKFKACLDLWESRENDGQRYYQGARKGVSFLLWVVKMANRGLADYVPGPVRNPILPRAKAFKEAEIRRAERTFAFDPKQDLVYLTDPRHPDLFVQL
ncbi:hypothetical protein EV127DRAFT_409091 [Xylaria flabelliformis]|nr:hypothetical protein EV127DRAFT_409091 [Xylaria flabelliformis]